MGRRGSVDTGTRGVEGAYLMMPPSQTPSPDFREAKAVLAAYKQALANAAPPKVVALSSMGSEKTQRPGPDHLHPPHGRGPA